MITNYLSPLEFIVSVRRMPNVQFFTQRAAIPSVAVIPVERPSPFKVIYDTGDKMSYGDLNLSFIIDEKMNNYLEVYNWMLGIAFPDEFAQYDEITGQLYGIKSDISVVIMNSHKNPNIEIIFKECFPINLSEITLDTTLTDVQYPEATATFAYNSFTITQLIT
jgi:hypothetical protein